MKHYVMGMDAGATKSHLAIFDTEAKLIAFGSWGPLNHEVLPGSFEQLEAELCAFISDTLSANRIDIRDIEYSVFGLAGVDTKEQHGIISGIIRNIGFERFRLCNDAYLGISAMCPNGSGICCINGSGYTIAGVNGGRMLLTGGLGMISNDLGGAWRIGMSVLGAVYDDIFRAGEPTALTRHVLDALELEDIHDYADAISKLTSDRQAVSNLNRLLFEHTDDSVSRRLLSDIAQNYAGGISYMIGALGFHPDETVPIVLAGSVFAKEKNPILIDMIKQKLTAMKSEHGLSYNNLRVPPVAGAVIWALRELGVSYDVSVRAGARLSDL